MPLGPRPLLSGVAPAAPAPEGRQRGDGGRTHGAGAGETSCGLTSALCAELFGWTGPVGEGPLRLGGGGALLPRTTVRIPVRFPSRPTRPTSARRPLPSTREPGASSGHPQCGVRTRPGPAPGALGPRDPPEPVPGHPSFLLPPSDRGSGIPPPYAARPRGPVS